MITFSSKGDWTKTESFLKRNLNSDIRDVLRKNAQAGVTALANATPVDSGLSARSWDYEIEQSARGASITWTNSNMTESGTTPVVILLQYGHGTGTGGYVAGRDFINPAIKPVFDQISENVWKAVKSNGRY